MNPEPLVIETRGHCLEITMPSALDPHTLCTKAVQSHKHPLTREGMFTGNARAARDSSSTVEAPQTPTGLRFNRYHL